MAEWYRVDDFAKKDDFRLTRIRTNSPHSWVRQITIGSHVTCKLIHFSGNPVFQEKLNLALEKFFPVFCLKHDVNDPTSITLVFPNDLPEIEKRKFLSALVRMFIYLNQINSLEFPENLTLELLNLLGLDFNEDATFYVLPKKDVSSIAPTIKPPIDPQKIDKGGIADTLWIYSLGAKPPTPFMLNKILKRLVQGYDPNEVSLTTGETSLESAVHYNYSAEIVKTLLAYGACPFYRNKGTFLSPRELAKLKNMVAFDVIQQFIDYLNKPRQNPFNVNECKIFQSGNEIHADLKLQKQNNEPDRILLELSYTKKLSPNEKNLFELYCKFFIKSPIMRYTIAEFFAHEVSGKDKFIEKVFTIENGIKKLAGLNLYEIITYADKPEVIEIHISCLLLDDSLQGRRLSEQLALTLPHAMRMLFPNKVITGTMQCISYGSYSMMLSSDFGSDNPIEELAHFPKYSTPEWEEFAKQGLVKIQRNPLDDNLEPELVCDPPTCYSEIEVQVQNNVNAKKKQAHQMHPNEFLFRRMLGGQNARDHHGAFIKFIVDEASWEKYKNICHKMHIEPFQYIQIYSQYFARLIPELNPTSNTVMRLNRHAFWHFGKNEIRQDQQFEEQKISQTHKSS